MFSTDARSLTPDYPALARQLASLLAGERDFVTNAAQFSAFVFQTVAELNWAGFYLAVDEQLRLGPFQGQVACVHIPFGRGVCGTAAATRQTQLVPDVEAFPGHIACDSASRAEMVLPVEANGVLWGVFDVDSPVLNRFSPADADGLQMLLAVLIAHTDPPRL